MDRSSSPECSDFSLAAYSSKGISVGLQRQAAIGRAEFMKGCLVRSLFIFKAPGLCSSHWPQMCYVVKCSAGLSPGLFACLISSVPPELCMQPLFNVIFRACYGLDAEAFGVSGEKEWDCLLVPGGNWSR